MDKERGCQRRDERRGGPEAGLMHVPECDPGGAERGDAGERVDCPGERKFLELVPVSVGSGLILISHIL